MKTFMVSCLIFLFFILSLKITAQTVPEPDERAPGTLSGYVFDYYGLAIADALVGLTGGPFTYSGPDGHYTLEEVVAGEVEIGCAKPGFNVTWVTVMVPAGDTISLDFNLTQPEMVINPLLVNTTLNPEEYITTTVNVLNTGTGILKWQAEVNFLNMPPDTCNYSIALYDTWGDGWTGSSLDVMVNDSIVLDNITLTNGPGPAIFYIPVQDGDQITTHFNSGTFITEPYYYLYDVDGEQVWFSPAANTGPPDILPGQLYAICDAGRWLTMDYQNGEVQPFGGVDNIPVHLSATGTESGQSFNADIVFSSTPDVGVITVPVSMNILGNALLPPDSLSALLLNDTEGIVELAWTWEGDAFQFFLIKRNGQIIATTAGLNYTDLLPDNGNYCYTVQSVYTEGLSVPDGPACVEWPDPLILVNPDSLEGWVWPGYTVDVFTTIHNQGEGSLSYSFPEFASRKLFSDSLFRGAGGPDDYGYVWIDSDETSGPEFEYTDISTTGTPVYGLSDDNIVGPFDIGFDFYFYGDPKNEFWINSNGCIGFSDNYITIGNTPIPTQSSIYNDFIGWMWDDLVFSPGTSQAFYQVFDNQLIIQFINFEYFNQPGQYINAQLVLFENGKILLLYDDFGPGVALNSCTVGLQSSDPEIGLQVAFNADYLHNDLAVLLNIPASFIVDVSPASGTIPEGGSETITITYDSKDYEAGPYSQNLLLVSNDHSNRELVLENTMHVYTPAVFTGLVTNRDNNEPLNGAVVTAGPFQASTNELGEYRLYVDAGVYDIEFQKLGFRTVTIKDTLGVQGLETQVDISLWDMNYPPGDVYAEMAAGGDMCEVTWSLPHGPYEMIMDDGEADDFFVFAHAGSWHAVKFTPSAYPALAIGGQFYVGDGSFPGPFLGTEFGVAVFDDDGLNGLPGTMLDSSGVTVNNSGWVHIDWLKAEITDGSFYLAMYQHGNTPNAAPIGIDLDNPTFFRSYTRIHTNDWILSPYQDFMIRAWIDGPIQNVTVLHEESGRIVNLFDSRNVVNYTISRYTAFDPDDPLAGGTYTQLTITENLSYTDNVFPVMQYWAAYGVKAMYTSGLYSEYTLSNIVGFNMDVDVDVSVTLTTGEEPSGVEVTLEGLDYPHETFQRLTSADGLVSFDTVWKGTYNIRIYKLGFEIYKIDSVLIDEDESFTIILSEKKYAPGCFIVDPLTLMATWCAPLVVALEEDFEQSVFPPEGWQASPAEGAWFRTPDGSSERWMIPAWDSYYACTNDEAGGSDSDGCCDYLITPPLDLRESDEFTLYFDSYYDGLNGQQAFIEYSFDAGETWNVLSQIIPDLAWTRLEIELDSICGEDVPDPVWLAFRADDAGNWASGWAIDNVSIQVPAQSANYTNFAVFLDDVYYGNTLDLFWDFAPLPYGQTYTAAVAAQYSSGISQKVYYTFTSRYLFPPQDLSGNAPDDAALLSWNPPGTNVPVNLTGYSIYRDDVLIAFREHAGAWEPQSFVDQNLDPGIYQYTASATYDLTPYGFPGDTGESMTDGPAQVIVDYCNDLPFFESWDQGNFGHNMWISDGPNWSVNEYTGNPPPVAKFSWDPLQNDYKIAIESYPLCAYGLTEGSIVLEFDLALSVIQTTGYEWFKVQIWEWEDKEWTTVREFHNGMGNFDWTLFSVDISEQALNKVFKIRFMAGGKNSIDVKGWFLDNIHVFRTCNAPGQLVVDPYYYDGIRLNWQLGGSDMQDSRALSGCKIYRSIDGASFEQLPALATGSHFVDDDPGLNHGSVICYKVTALYEGESDLCESEFSNEVCVVFTPVKEEQDTETAELVIFPNPAGDQITLSSSQKITRVIITGITGKVVFEQEFPPNHQVLLDVSSLPTGLYTIQAFSTETSVTRKLAVAR